MKNQKPANKLKYLHGCAGKVKHKSRLSAEYFINNRHSKEDAEIYQCEECGSFHIGSSRNSKSKIKIKKSFDNEQHKNKHKRFKY